MYVGGSGGVDGANTLTSPEISVSLSFLQLYRETIACKLELSSSYILTLFLYHMLLQAIFTISIELLDGV